MSDWTTQHARELYNISRWGQNFFDINDAGKVIACNPAKPQQAGIELSVLAHQLREKGFDFPILIRFIDILHFRIKQLCDCFARSIRQSQYQGQFTLVYPVKVNQQFSVVDAIVNHPTQAVGLEAGSKTELLAILSLTTNPQTVIVCNGYKDKDYIRLALIGEQLGYHTYIVLEKFSELPLLLQQANILGVTPRIGIRIQLNSTGCGMWQNTGGDKSKFGLSANDVLAVIDNLKNSNKLDWLQLLHFHLGSQIPDIKFIQRATTESAQYLVQLNNMGCQIKCVDVGGGLGVDYAGTNSDSDFSINYQLTDYAECIVNTFQQICDQHAITHPNIFTESGRAMTAHHAVLITNVVEFESTETVHPGDTHGYNCPELVRLEHILSAVNAQETGLSKLFSQAEHSLKHIQQLFILGQRDLAQRAKAEQLFRSIVRNIQRQNKNQNNVDATFSDLINQKLAAKYFCNFSLFQSLPDIWALKQIFPITPLQRLSEKPEIHGVLRDITCDSDGRIDNYIENDSVEHSLRLHAIQENELYLVGFFLVGAYQEILGDMHNLFGDTHSVNINFTPSGFDIGHQQRGDSVEYILKHIHFDPENIIKNFEVKIKSAMLNPKQTKQFMTELKSGLSAYSYLKSNSF